MTDWYHADMEYVHTIQVELFGGPDDGRFVSMPESVDIIEVQHGDLVHRYRADPMNGLKMMHFEAARRPASS